MNAYSASVLPTYLSISMRTQHGCTGAFSISTIYKPAVPIILNKLVDR